MLKKTLPLLTAAAAMSFASNAMATTGFYLSANTGYAIQQAPGSVSAGAITMDSVDKGRFAWNGLVGYNRDFKNLWGAGLEFGYADYGSVKWSQDGTSNAVDIAQTAYLAQLVGTYHALPNFDLQGKLGLAFGYTNINTRGTIGITDSALVASSAGTNELERNIKAVIGLSGTYFFMPALGANLSWTHIFGNKFKSSNTDQFQTINAFMLGFTFILDQ